MALRDWNPIPLLTKLLDFASDALEAIAKRPGPTSIILLGVVAIVLVGIVSFCLSLTKSFEAEQCIQFVKISFAFVLAICVLAIAYDLFIRYLKVQERRAERQQHDEVFLNAGRSTQ